MKQLAAALLALVSLATHGADAPVKRSGSDPKSVDVVALRKQASERLGPLPEAGKDSPALVDLGRKLYFDTRLSANRSISCNSCHRLDQGRGGVDNDKTSVGAYTKRGTRNAPTTLNAGSQVACSWTGLHTNLTSQIKAHITNTVELAMPGEAELVQRLSESKDYPPLFVKAFPDGKASLDTVAQAIEAHVRSLRTQDRFDEFLKGDDNALTLPELNGLQKFLQLGCVNCHNGPLLGGNSFQKLGVARPNEELADLGRFDVTKNNDDKYKFKVPTLRNVALTAPYFHDGSRLKLEDAVRDMANLQLGKRLQPDDTQAIAAFLTALTDKERDTARKARLQR